MDQADISQLENAGTYNLVVNGEDVTIELADVEIISEDIPGWLVANQDKLTVALDINISDDLLNEGIARELVNRIQNLRKSQDFEITNRIKVSISSNEKLDGAITQFTDYIKSQVLADIINITTEQQSTEIEINEEIITIDVEKI